MPGPGNIPRSMSWGAAGAPPNCFEALGVPITPIDDRGLTNTYPMFRLVARDAANNVLAQTDVVLPVSTELNCSTCHASGIGQPAAMPSPSWVYDPNPKRDFRLNALKLHDQKNLANPAYVAALAQFSYRSTGLVRLRRSGWTIDPLRDVSPLGGARDQRRAQHAAAHHLDACAACECNRSEHRPNDERFCKSNQLLPMPSRFHDAMFAWGDGRSRVHIGWFDADAMPELPRLDEHRRIGLPHRLV